MNFALLCFRGARCTPTTLKRQNRFKSGEVRPTAYASHPIWQRQVVCVCARPKGVGAPVM